MNNIENIIQDIAKYRNSKKISFIRTIIGQYRLNAQKFHGYVRWHIHQQANKIENSLNEALNAYKKTSGKIQR